MAAVDCVGAGVAQLAGRNVGDLVRAGAAVVGAKGTSGGIPQQRIVFQAGHAVVDAVDGDLRSVDVIVQHTQRIIDLIECIPYVRSRSSRAIDRIGIGERITRSGHAAVGVDCRATTQSLGYPFKLRHVHCVGIGDAGSHIDYTTPLAGIADRYRIGLIRNRAQAQSHRVTSRGLAEVTNGDGARSRCAAGVTDSHGIFLVG
ncbi:hypothetical protein D3C81_1421720 [compost metagenome]